MLILIEGGILIYRKVEMIFESYINDDSYFNTQGRQPKLPFERLNELKKKYSKEEYDEIEDLIFSVLSIGEKQGFINGITYFASENLSDF